jgi:hypothetical protein
VKIFHYRDLTISGGDQDQDRRLRREIANSNERRRMQSINAGFQSLRTLLPHHEGEKLSKVRKNHVFYIINFGSEMGLGLGKAIEDCSRQ